MFNRNHNDYLLLADEAAAQFPEEAEFPPEVLAEVERDRRLAERQSAAISKYQEMRKSGVADARLDDFFESNRGYLESAGIRHYPLLSDAEKEIIAGWQDLEARNERQSVKQDYFNEHGDVIFGRWKTENPDYEPSNPDKGANA